MSGFGEYPVEYNSKVHGAYDPAKYYGKGYYLRNHKLFINRILNNIVFKYFKLKILFKGIIILKYLI